VKVLAAGVSLPDVLAREGVHPETPRVPYTPGWDLVGTVDQLGRGVIGFEPGQAVAAMPIHGCYAQYVCVSQRKFVPVPAGLNPAEAVAVVLNSPATARGFSNEINRAPGSIAWIGCPTHLHNLGAEFYFHAAQAVSGW
jgi:NADPH:quinone reductase